MTNELLYKMQIETLRGEIKAKCEMLGAAIAEKEKYRAALEKSMQRERDALNAMCDKCGKYREEHNGACDGCRWHHGKA